MAKNETPNNSSVQTFDRFAEEYDQKYVRYQPYIDTYEKLSGLIPSHKLCSVLDVGCGPAHASKYLISAGFDLEVFGIDLSPNMLRMARKNVPDGRFEQFDCRNLDVLDREFDIVICGFCMPYLEPFECSKLTGDIASALKPGGIGYISAIEGEEYHVEDHFSPSGDIVRIHHHPAASLLQEFLRVDLNVLDVERKTIVTTDGSEDVEVFFYVRSGS